MTASQLPSSDLVYDTTSVYTKIFIGLQLAGLIGNILTLIVAYFSPVSRQATWYSCISIWCFYSIAFLLLFFSGHYHDPSPPFNLCLVQSALLHAASPSATAGTLALVIQLYFSVYSALNLHPIPHQNFWFKVLLLFPYALCIILVALFLALSLTTHPTTTFNVTAYCAVNQIVPGRITAGLTIALNIPMLIINGLIYIRLRKHWSEFRASHLGRYTSMIIRASLFSICAFVALCAGFGFFLVVLTPDPNEPIDQIIPRLLLAYNILNIFLSMFPVAVMLIFGTHEDILRRLFFCRKQESYSLSEHAVPTMSLTVSSPPLEESFELESRIRTIEDSRFNESQSSGEIGTLSKGPDGTGIQGAIRTSTSPWKPP
ncbi:hypothetical protein EV361DRAFT_49511 [Lentinula raphanica]|uniref:Uncharacterized protein n=1 Tax=Lentinula raphanica TaxID=153919 RepID=A0AA38PM24_9AGAR|nr:hypothetical protein F5878DRAFT_600466 [Lentinula raphanica]KAJ3973581.1 hypothetical protein EV361DRAFT_49511 [Lentinula raphanica]